MLPIPIFLILVFSVAILSPAPAILIHLMKTVNLPAPSPHISIMPTPPLTYLPPAEETLYLPVPDPQLNPDVVPVCRGQSFVGIAPGSTTPLLQPHEASGYYTPHAAILPVVILAMVNCLVYKLLVDDTSGTRAEEESEQPMPAHVVPIMSEESTCYYTIYEIPSPRPVVDTDILTTGFLEHDGLSDVVTAPSCLELEHGPQSSVLFEQSSHFPGVLPYGALTEDAEKATDHDSSLATLTVLSSTSCDDWTQGPTAQSTDSWGSSPETLVATLKHSDFVPPQCGPLDIEAVKAGVDLSSVPLSQEPVCRSEPQDDHTMPSAIEGTCDVNSEHEAILSDDPDDDETFDYKGVDWEPRASNPSPPANVCATFPPYSSLELHSRTPSKEEHGPAPSYFSTSSLREAALQSSTMYASDDIQVGVKCKNKAKVAYNTRRMIKCASSDNLRGTVDLFQATPFPVPANDPATSVDNIADKCISINQVAPLRADVPVYTPGISAMSEEVDPSAGPSQPPVFLGLKASIHAPRNDDLLQTHTQECVGTLDSMHTTKQASPLAIGSQTRSHSPELVSAADGIQGSTHSATKPGSQELAYPAAAEPRTPQASELEPSTLALAEGNIQPHKEPSEIQVPPTTPAKNGPNSPRGLAASIHAPQGRQAVHSADAPNWAAAAREDSTAASRGSSSAQRGKTPEQGPDDGGESDVPTATRCAVQDESEESGVDDSDGSMHPADDRDGPLTGSYETGSGLDADDPNEQEFATRSRRARRRGKPRRPRTKVPYLPPPRMRNLTQHPIVDMIAEAQALHRLAAGSVVSNGQHYSLPQPSQHPASVSDQLGQPLGYHQTPQQHMGSPSTAPLHISSPQSHTSPAPYYPVLYPQNPHGERATPLVPCPLPYGR